MEQLFSLLVDDAETDVGAVREGEPVVDPLTNACMSNARTISTH